MDTRRRAGVHRRPGLMLFALLFGLIGAGGAIRWGMVATFHAQAVTRSAKTMMLSL